MELTQDQERVDDTLMSYYEELYGTDPDTNPAVSADNIGFYQKIIYEMIETKYPLSPREDSCHVTFLTEFTKHYDHFVRLNSGTVNDSFMWRTLAGLLINECLELEQVESTIEEIEKELALLRVKLKEEQTDEEAEDEMILDATLLALSDFKRNVMDNEDELEGFDYSGIPLLPKKRNTSEVGDLHKALETGAIEKEINTFFAPHLDGTDGLSDVSVQMEPEAVENFYLKTVDMIVAKDFEFDFLNNRYHISFINAFTEMYRQQIEDRNNLEGHAIWNRLAGLLVAHVFDLKPENVEQTLNLVDKQIQSFDDPSTDFTDAQQILINSYYKTLIDFQECVLELGQYVTDFTISTKKTDLAGVPEVSKVLRHPELRDGVKAMDTGMIEKEINTFFAPLVSGELNKDNVHTRINVDSLKDFYLITIDMIAQKGFKFDFENNEYHLLFLQTFTSIYQNQVTNAPMNLKGHFFWKNMADLLTTYAEDLKPENVSDMMETVGKKNSCRRSF